MYSKIVSIELINFMVFKHARISFDERGIINLKGYNSSGKSTIERAIAVCLMDAFKRKQAKFIRHNEDFFRVVIEFDDGVKIVRDKYINGQSLYEMYKYNECLFSTKEGSKLTKVDCVPDIIQKYLGLISMQDSYLNYQSRRDPLWLIDTAGSDNYYSLHEVLKTESLARAGALLNSDKNKIGSEIAEIEGELQSVELSLSNCSDVTEELLSVLSEREIYARGICDRLSKISKINELLASLAKIKKIPKIEDIEYSRLSSILEIDNKFLELEKEVPIPKIEKLEIEKFNFIENLLENLNELDKCTGKSLSVDIETVSLDKVPMISSILSKCKELGSCLNTLKELKDENNTVSNRLEEVAKEAHNRGTRFVKCESCGSYMEVGESIG